MTYKSAVSVEKIPAWEQQSGSDEPWFDVPKVWDSLSNTKMGVKYLLPEKSKNNIELEVHEDGADQQIEEETLRFGDSDDINTLVGNPEGVSHSVSCDDKEEGFLSIGLSPKNLFVGGLKMNKEGDHRREQQLGKHRKRKRK